MNSAIVRRGGKILGDEIGTMTPAEQIALWADRLATGHLGYGPALLQECL